MYNLDYEAAQYLLNKYSYQATATRSTGVYLLECQGYYKIGITSNVSKRVQALQVGNPLPINIVIFCAVGEARKVEKQLHKAYSNKNVSGEWFKLSEEEASVVVRIIKNRC
jgi:hypothetical protein